MPKPPKSEMSKILDLWVASDLKVQLLAFYHDNPGVMETLQGLALRLGTNANALRKEISGHLALGLIKEQKAGPMTILVFDRKREGEVQGAIEQHIMTLSKTAAKGSRAKGPP